MKIPRPSLYPTVGAVMRPLLLVGAAYSAMLSSCDRRHGEDTSGRAPFDCNDILRPEDGTWEGIQSSEYWEDLDWSEGSGVVAEVQDTIIILTYPIEDGLTARVTFEITDLNCP